MVVSAFSNIKIPFVFDDLPFDRSSNLEVPKGRLASNSYYIVVLCLV